MESRGLVEKAVRAAPVRVSRFSVSASVLQLLFAKSDESKNVDGLALLNGEIVSIPKDMELKKFRIWAGILFLLSRTVGFLRIFG